MKYTLKVKRPCDSDFSVFMESKNIEVIKHGWLVARYNGWQSRLIFPKGGSR
jgi:hypothetical protein